MFRLRTRQIRRLKPHHRWTCKKWVLTENRWTHETAHIKRLTLAHTFTLFDDWFPKISYYYRFIFIDLVEYTRSKFGWGEKTMAYCNFGWCQSWGSETLYGHFQDDQRSKLIEIFWYFSSQTNFLFWIHLISSYISYENFNRLKIEMRKNKSNKN